MTKAERFFLIGINGNFTQPTTNLKGLVELFNSTVAENPYKDCSIAEVDSNLNYVRTIIAKNCVSKYFGYGNEHCPHCDSDTPFYVEFKAFHCTHCGKSILPCSLCDKDRVDCNECPLKGKNRTKLGGIV